MSKRLIVLRNFCSGRRKTFYLWPEVIRVLQSKSPSVKVVPTELGRIAEQARELAAEADIVVAAGGDGTIHAVAAGLIGSNTPLGIIPMGTGNDLARTLGIPSDPVLAAGLLSDGEPSPMDAVRFRCSGSEGYSLNIAGVGFDASVAQRINDGFRFLKGTSAYLAAVLQCLASYRPVYLSISVDGESFATSAMLCAVANAQYYGGGMKIAPNASVNDGLIDVVVVGGVSKLEFLRQFPRVFKGTHLSHPAVRCLQGRSVRIEASAPIPVLADGEIVGLTPVEFEMVPEALKVVRGWA